MTKEELEKESEKYFKSICEDYNEEYERTGKRHYFVGFDIKNAYLAGAEPREKRIAELEAQIEKMKQDLDSARENANRQEQWEIYSVLNGIYNDNFEVITSVSN